MKKILLILFLLSSTSLFAQTETKISKERFNFLIDSLKTRKTNLLTQKIILKAQIDSLENVITGLDSKVKSAHIKKLYRKYGRKIGGRLAAGKIWKGMTEQMLKDSWGQPDRKTRNKKKWGLFTQWYYGTITYYFKNGKLTDWKEK